VSYNSGTRIEGSAVIKESKYDRPVSFRFRSDVRDKLRVLAAHEDRSRNNMLKHLIEAEYNRLARYKGTEAMAELEEKVLGS